MLDDMVLSPKCTHAHRHTQSHIKTWEALGCFLAHRDALLDP